MDLPILHGGECREMPFHTSWKKHRKQNFQFNNILMENIKEQKILGVITDNKLNFKSLINEFYKSTVADLDKFFLFNCHETKTGLCLFETRARLFE